MLQETPWWKSNPLRSGTVRPPEVAETGGAYRFAALLRLSKGWGYVAEGKCALEGQTSFVIDDRSKPVGGRFDVGRAAYGAYSDDVISDVTSTSLPCINP